MGEQAAERGQLDRNTPRAIRPGAQGNTMEGTRIATLDDERGNLHVEVYLSNGWHFARYRYTNADAWKAVPKPYKHTLGAIRGAYYYGTGRI